MTASMTNCCAVRSPDGVYACELAQNHAPTIHASHRFQDVVWVVWLDGKSTYSPPPRENPQLRHCMPCSREWIGPVGGPCDSCEGPGRIGPLGWTPYRASEYSLSFRTTPRAIATEDEAVRRARIPWWRRWWRS